MLDLYDKHAISAISEYFFLIILDNSTRVVE